jgi:copper chaperone NosL
VLNSNKRAAAGMGNSRREPIPFSDRAAAQDFQKAYGGRIARFVDIPQDEILGSGAAQEPPSDVRSNIARAAQNN